MKLPKKNIRGFTVVELIISILLGGIIIGLAFTFLVLFQRYLHRSTGSESKYVEIQRFKSSFSSDLNKYNLAEEKHGLLLYKKGENIFYQFNEHYILRENQHYQTDTFHIGIEYIDFQYKENYTDLIEYVEVTLAGERDLDFITFSKNYNADICLKAFNKKKK